MAAQAVGRNQMKALEIIPYKGKNIVMVDLSNSTTEQLVAALRDAQQKISKLPAKSALIMTDATKAAYNPETGAAIKEFAAKNTPYVKASAVVGVEGMKAVLQTAVAMSNKRDIAAFPTRGEAMDWLATR
jgi:ABC-type nitrate/sulfonate/bicarbonate transport system substrate-binding protein